MIAQIFATLAAILIITGSVFSLLAAIGLLRFPDFYTRLHAVSLAGGMGSGAILIATAVAASDSSIALRAILGAIFMLMTTPVSSHLLARISHRHKIVSPLIMRGDDLAGENKSM